MFYEFGLEKMKKDSVPLLKHADARNIPQVRPQY